MMVLVGLLGIPAAAAGLYVLLTYGVLRLARRFGGKIASTLVGAISTGLLVYWIVDIRSECGAEPKYIPCAGEVGCDVGQMIFACDGPMGMMAYWMTNIILPLSALITSILTWRVYWRSAKPTHGV